MVEHLLSMCWACAPSIPSTKKRKKKRWDVDRCDPVMSAFRDLQKNLSLKLTQFLNGWIMEHLLERGITFRLSLWSSVSSGQANGCLQIHTKLKCGGPGKRRGNLLQLFHLSDRKTEACRERDDTLEVTLPFSPSAKTRVQMRMLPG